MRGQHYEDVTENHLLSYRISLPTYQTREWMPWAYQTIGVWSMGRKVECFLQVVSNLTTHGLSVVWLTLTSIEAFLIWWILKMTMLSTTQYYWKDLTRILRVNNYECPYLIKFSNYLYGFILKNRMLIFWKYFSMLIFLTYL